MDEETIQAMSQYKRPQNLKNLRGFLGVIHYFKELMSDISEKQIPLTKLMQKGVNWIQGEEQENDIY